MSEWINTMKWLALYQIKKYNPGVSILDFGCSISLIITNGEFFERVRYTGVHPDQETVSRASRCSRKTKFFISPLEFFEPEEKSDIVFILEELEKVVDPKPILKSLARATRKGGEIYVAFKNNPIEGDSIIKKSHRFYDNTYSAKWLIAEFGYSKVVMREKYVVDEKEIWRLERT